VPYEFLFQAFEVEISAIAQELGAVVFVFDVDRVAAEEMEDFCKDVGGAVGYIGGHY